MIYIWLVLFRLVSALFWALIFWVVGSVLNIKRWDYGTSYLAVMNFYAIVLIIESFLFYVWQIPPFSTFIIFAILFGLNFWHLKNNDSTNQNTNSTLEKPNQPV